MEKLPNQADEELREKYDIVFIGGGPATLSFFSFMCRNRNFENFFSNLNILILEKSETFGSGCLGKYGINSNTSAEGFVRLICFNDDENGKEEKQNLSPSKKKVNETSKNHFFNNSNNKENNSNVNNNNILNTSATNFTNSTIFQKFKNKCVPIFEDLLHSNETKNLLGIGSKIAPLSMIGNFLDCVGNSITSYIYNKFHKRIFMNYCEVMKINLDYDKCFENSNLKITDIKNSNIYPYEIFVEKTLKNLSCNSHRNSTNNNNGNNSNVKDIIDNIKHFTIKSKLVILGSGAQQKFDNKQKQDILKLIGQGDFFHSDYILQETGFNHLLNNLKLKEKKRVVIIGGSHSGFSCAWMLLNGYIDIHKLKEQNKSIRLSSAFPNNNNNGNPASEGINKNYSNNIHHNGVSYRPKINKNCENCKNNNCCFGSVIDRSWRSSKSANSHLPFNNVVFNLDNLEIQILYRDHIKVYYHSEREALNDGYNVYDQNKAVNKNGNVYPFIGIRGDAKELYRKIVTGKEKRVKLQKCNNFNDQKNYINKASVVIWACGYTTHKMNFFESNNRNKEIEFYTDSNNQFDVDKELHVLNKKKNPFLNLFGIGQGYSTHSIELLSSGKYARADSVNLYNTYISKKLFRALDYIFNFTGENLSTINAEKEKENMKKTSNLNNNNMNNNKNNSNSNNGNNNNNKKANSDNNNNNSKQYNSNLGNNNNNENHMIKNKEINNKDTSNKKIIQIVSNENNNLRNSSILNNNNNNVNGNQAANSTISKKTNGQNFFNSPPNLKTVKLPNNNNNINNSESKKLIKNTVIANSVYQNNNNNIINNLVGNNYNTNIVLLNDLSKSQSNLKDKNGKNISNNNLLRASNSKGFEKYGNSSKTNFYKSHNNNESNTENTNHNIKYNNFSNMNNDFSPPSRSIKSRSPINVNVSETAVKNRNHPVKRESSKLKTLHSSIQNSINMSNMNSNNILIQNVPKTNPIQKNFSNLTNIVNNNINGYNNFSNMNNNFSNLTGYGNGQNNLTPNIYTNKNVIISRDYLSKSPKNRNVTSNFISTSNIDVLKNSYKDLNLKEKNLVATNSSYLRKTNITDIVRNQVYFGKTQNSSNLKNPNSISQNNISSDKFNEINNINNNNINHVKFPSFNSPPLEKPANKYHISPITNINRSKSKYILYDSTKNVAGNINSNQNHVINNINSNMNSHNLVNLLGKN